MQRYQGLALCAIHLFLVAACGVTNFFPSVVQTLNFDRTTTLCLTAPPYVIAVVATYLWAKHADHSGERFYHVTIPLVLSLVAFIISAASLNTGARYFSMCLMIPSFIVHSLLFLPGFPTVVQDHQLNVPLLLPLSIV